MNKRNRIIILSILSVLIVITLVLGITKAFMKPIMDTSSITEVSLNSCAKISLTDTGSINLSNSYPLSTNKGLETKPYTFTVTSYCDAYVGFNLYVATLNTNTLNASNIRYIITPHGEKTIIKEGLLGSATDAVSEFSAEDKTELNIGINGNYGNIYKIHNDKIPLKGSVTLDLYLFIDSNASNDTMNKTFNAGIAVKSYDREDDSLAGYIKRQYTSQGAGGLYLHNSSLANGAGDNSYRYAGANPNNYVCFGSTTKPCPADNLYRIIGVFNNQVKLIKSTIAPSTLLGTDGDYESGNNYYWNNSTNNNNWNESNLNKINLNTNYINKLGTTWTNKIATTTWKVGGNTEQNIIYQVPSVAYKNEIVTPAASTTYNAKIGLMYVSDYGFAADPSAWTTTLYNYHYEINISTKSWIFISTTEWTISRISDYPESAFTVNDDREINDGSFMVRPVFYLTSSVSYASGSGTSADPIVIN